MTGLAVAEPQPLWLSLQHTLPSFEISDTPADTVAAALVVIADSTLALVELAGLAGLFPFQIPLMWK